MKKYFAILCCTLLAAAACQPNTDDNKGLEWESLDVNFTAALNGQSWPAGAELGVIATCTRNGEEGVLMSENPVARYVVAEAGETSRLTAATDTDKIISLKGDHNYRFHVVYPYPEGEVDLSAIPVGVPVKQNHADGIMKSLTFLGSANVISVIPTVQMKVSTMFSILEFNVPNDLRDGFESTIKTMKVTPPAGFNGQLAQGGTFNVYDGTFTPSPSASSNEITMDFGNGLKLEEPYTKVYLAVAPFTVPEGGLNLTFTDVDGTATEITAFNSDKEIGSVLAAGETMSAYLSGFSDGIIPVTFPVVFPMGYPDGATATTQGYNNPTVTEHTWVQEWYADEACSASGKSSHKKTDWTGHHGTFYCADQPQAYMKWVWDEKIADLGIVHFIETTNSLGTNFISTVGVKGVWTDDYFEFVIPVRKFAAGSTLCLKLSLYTRQGPTFWEVLYLDGDQWKSTAKDNLPAYEGAEVTARATWAIPYLATSATVDNEQSVNMTFENEINSGEIHIKVKCVDGSILSSGNNAVTTGNLTPYGGTTASAPFYFWNPGKRDNHDIRIELL